MRAIEQALQKILLEVQKPAQYAGGEYGSIVKKKEEVNLRFAFCFPDKYDVGMSHLGMKILYSVINERPDYWCERVFAPWTDMEALMRRDHIPLYALESKDPVKSFDIIGFTLQYELCYTNVLNMLDLAGIPLLAKDRKELSGLVVAGGPCVCNPEPVSDYIDLFMPGEGEEVILELCDAYAQAKKQGLSKEDFLVKAAQIKGIYVPSLYDVSYQEDGTICSFTSRREVPLPVKKRVIEDFDQVYYPSTFVVPFTEIVHDRAVLEVLRGCIRGCRFCQAGFIYRPFREKQSQTLCAQGKALCDSTGYDEISLSSLSTSDYSELPELLDQMLPWSKEEKVNLSLPSLRIDNFSPELLEKSKAVRKSGLTFAPEAGTQRLRDAINKNISEEEILRTAQIAFEGGYDSIKLYFMIGLPTETMEDIEGIAQTAQKIVDLFYAMPREKRGRGVRVSITVSSFVPKPFTPFQFEPQDTKQQLEEKQRYLRSCVCSNKISLSCHTSDTSYLEGVFARGDRRLGALLLEAWKNGCRFDGWSECFDLGKWNDAFTRTGIDPAFYANRRRGYDEILPWDHLDYGVTKAFLIRENEQAHQSAATPNCREKCAGCGANRLDGGCSFV